MQERQKVLSWHVELTKPDSVAYLGSDNKGNIARSVLEKTVKGKKKFFTYYGVNLPYPIQRELSGMLAGLKLVNLPEPQAINADVVMIDHLDQWPYVSHNRVVFSMVDLEGVGVKAKPVQVTKDEDFIWVWPPNAMPDRPFEVKTRNCVEDDIIQHNLLHNLNLGLPQLPACAAHGQTASVISAGPSLINYMDTIGKETQKPDTKVACVKHSHDLLLDAGVVPWACMLLDPRDHVKDFIENPHPEVKYFVSSTCAPTTLDRLVGRGANVWLYHALVGAGEQSLVAMHNSAIRTERKKIAGMLKKQGSDLPAMEPFEMVDHLVVGGTTAASRGISVLHLLGFRRFRLFGFDSCFWEQPDMTKRKDDGQPCYHKLNLAGKDWFTDAELVAQVQDFKAILPAHPDCTFEPMGDGMVPALVRSMGRRNWQLEEVFG